jgi:hypothetical protein
MFRAAIILQLILGLLVGPNGCCCAGQHLAAWLNPAVEASASSCCSTKSSTQSASRSCCSRTKSSTATRHLADSRSTPASQSCCGDNNQCECLATIRPSLHRNALETNEYELTITKSLLGDGWISKDASLVSTRILPDANRLQGFSSQPGRLCAIAFQRWNC